MKHTQKKIWRLGRNVLLALVIALLGGCVPLEFSPDGKQILLLAPLTKESAGLVLVNTDGSGFQMLPNGEKAGSGKWSPDGKKILILSDERELFLYDIKKKTSKPLTKNIEPPFAWREDSKAFAAIQVTLPKDNTPSRKALSRFDLDGYPMSAIPLGETDPFPFTTGVAWIPGTDDLIFVATQTASLPEKPNKPLGEATNSQARDLYMTEGDQIKKITNSGDVLGYIFLPQAKRLIWARRGKNLRYALLTLYAMDITQRTVTRLKFPDRVPALNPDPRSFPNGLNYVAFSPDGTRFVLHADLPKTGNSKANRNAIYALKIDGSEAKLLHQVEAASKGGGDVLLPAWSPDSRRIAIQVLKEQSAELYLINPDGTEKTRLKLPGTTTQPTPKEKR